MEDTVHLGVSYTSTYDEELTKRLENDFSRTEEECYLDHAGATLYSDTQIKHVASDLHNSLYGNPHSIGSASNVTQDIIERMRYLILDHFSVSPDEYSVIFTSGATAALKIIADTFVFSNDEKNKSGHFIYTQDNHTSVVGMREVFAKRGAKIMCLRHNNAFEIFNSPLKSKSSCSQESNSLFAYPAQCNFSGLKYPLSWIKDVRNNALSNIISNTSTKWYVLLDAAAFAATSKLDLSIYKPDFVCLSFYKMFGYPTGIGALLVKNSSAEVLNKVYYGGGTIDVSLTTELFHIKRKDLSSRFEDGTLPFLSIVSLKHGFDILSSITMEKISKHVFSLAKSLHNSLLMLHHSNGKPVVKLYSDTDYENREMQGGIVAFNLMRSNGEYVGYMEVLSMAALFKIHLRTGCFCNPGACQRHLGLSNTEVLQNYEAGYVCGGAADLINGRPTGAIRISFGYMSTIKDVQTLLLMIKQSFVDGSPIYKIPDWWLSHKTLLHAKYYHNDANVKSITSNNEQEITNKLQTVKESLMHLINENPFFKLTKNTTVKKKCILEQLYIYPIKSCAAYKIADSWSLNSKGLQYDREWMIISSAGTCLTQKQHINLCLLRPVIFKDKGIMQLHYPDMPSIDVSLDNNSINTMEGTVCQSRVCGHKVQGTDCGTDVSEWLSLAVGLPNLRLIRQTDSDKEKKGSNKPELSFSSQAQYLLINKASVLWLSDKISNTEVKKDTIIHRFRGNMILSSCEPFEETEWKYVTIGKNNFVVAGPCTRCQMICIDQTTGLKTVEPLRTLAEHFHGKLKFGIYLTKESTEDGILSIGDTVQIS
ncbi:molybdenum cofactor sulfurase 1 [Ceratina calcarata]|uniref:Molybdenum cofactor sulfurase n=1 Tax=Ceratina calcarata TaxID=156304 RepID=A0AAJ7J633_9HYME|nr:molybdenum cofactor sulfurase 1 [Ceratina calcarata]XP_017885615.1 molybdenum cofactor sulfurase 1 [Ceratina calcarata]XP_026672158.1 molybdenum cofactor sulfurase 1 [Ceratina calcarata]